MLWKEGYRMRKGFFNSRMNLIRVKKEKFGFESNPKALSSEGWIFSDLITATERSETNPSISMS